MTTDSFLKESVEDELRWDLRVDEAHIGVSAHDGSVTLSGRVTTYPAKMAAIEAAKRVRGVRAVADDVEVHLPSQHRREDSDVAERIAHVLEWNVSIPHTNIQAKVSSGYVTLTGEVDWEHQRRHVEQQVRHVGGVIGVVNSITIKPRTTPADVKEKIEKALHRHADLEASAVKVTVSGNKVTLDGKVKAYYERDLIERAAWGAPGVREVVDHIYVM